VPLTPLDRQTGRVAFDARDVVNANGALPGAGMQSGALPHRGSGEGGANGKTEHLDGGPIQGGPLFPGYSQTKCANQGRPLSARAPWLDELKLRTRSFRAQRSMRFRGRARLASDMGNMSQAKWNLDRAQGQQYRFEAVAGCGQREVVSSCADCGHEARRLEALCGHFRLCVTCRGHRARRYRTIIRVARRRALSEASKLGQPGAPGGPWGERFLTLTMPHSTDVACDLRVLPRAWLWFRRQLWKFFAREQGLTPGLLARLVFVRVMEVTPGSSNDGHAHLHVYMLSPFVPHELVRHLWGKALGKHGYQVPTRPLADVLAAVESPKRRAQLAKVLVTRRGPKGRPLDEVLWPVVDIRKCHGDVENELIKYLVKDAELEHGKLNLVEPDLYARIYEGLEGVRTVATSRHFFIKEDRACGCEQCGSTRLTNRVVKPDAPQADESEEP
jgi:hypothetical protein